QGKGIDDVLRAGYTPALQSSVPWLHRARTLPEKSGGMPSHIVVEVREWTLSPPRASNTAGRLPRVNSRSMRRILDLTRELSVPSSLCVIAQCCTTVTPSTSPQHVSGHASSRCSQRKK